MRDPERRQRILRLLEQIWMQDSHSDARLYQILGNATGVNSDPYDYEDDKLESELQAYLRRF